MATILDGYSVKKDLLLAESSIDRQHGLVESLLKPITSSTTKLATFRKVTGWSLVAWLAMSFLIGSANALPSFIKDSIPPSGGKGHFDRRDVLQVFTSPNQCGGSLVDWNKAHTAVPPTKNLKIEVLDGSIYGTIEVRTGDVANAQRMPEIRFAAYVTENDATGGLKLEQSVPGNTTSTFTLSVAPLTKGTIPYCAIVNITVIIPVDATTPYYDDDLAFVTQFVDVKTTSNLSRLSFGKFSFESSLGGLYVPSLRTKALIVRYTEGDVVVESLRSYKNESPIVVNMQTNGAIQLAVKTPPATRGTTEGTPHDILIVGEGVMNVNVSPDADSGIPSTTAEEGVPRPVKVSVACNSMDTVRLVLAEGQGLDLDIQSSYKVDVSVVSRHITFDNKKKENTSDRVLCHVCNAVFRSRVPSIVLLRYRCFFLTPLARSLPTCIAYIH